jgi:outer membrane lipoprotein-sorting protein
MWVVLISALALAACGGGGESVSQPASSPKAFVSAAEAMEASAVSYETQVQSFEGTMSIGFGAAGEEFSTSGDMKYEAPDKVYLSMDIPTVGEMEVLLDAPDMYFGVDGKWYKGDTSALGIDLDDFQKYAEDRGPVDYADALNGLKDVVKLSDEEIDGKTYWHYHAALDLDALSDELPADVIDPSLIADATDALSATSMDIYVDPETLLPRRYNMTMTMDFGAEPFTMNMTMDFVKYNGDVDMPDVPTDVEEFDPSAFGDGY